MTYAFSIDVPIDSDVYTAIRDAVGPETPEGLMVHLVHRTDNGLRYIDVWRSEDDWKRFASGRLQSAVEGVAAQFGVQPPEPLIQELTLVDAWIVASTS